MRLVAYVLWLAVILGSLEWLVRRHQGLIAAASNRGLAKAALLDRHGPIDVLFLGTSRIQDGVSPWVFTEVISEHQPALRLKAFNLSFTSSNLKSLEYLAERFAGREGLLLAVIELSAPQLSEEPPRWETSSPRSTTLEDRLAGQLAAHVKLVTYRNAFTGENLLRVPGLVFFSSRLDGSEVYLVDQVKAAFGIHPPVAPTYEKASWALGSAPSVEEVAASEAQQAVVARLASIAARFRQSHIAAAFVVPPLSFREPAEERMAPMKALLGAVAERSHCLVWDYSDQQHPEALFRDTTHLNSLGRAHFSQALAEQALASGLLGVRRAGAL